MIATLIIIGKTALALTLFFLFYRFVLSADKLFSRNRFFLLATAMLSFIFPLITIPLIEKPADQLLTFTYIEKGDSAVSHIAQSYTPLFSWSYVPVMIYVAGIAFFLLRSLIAYFQVYRIIKNASHEPLGKLKLVTTQLHLSPFSFLRWIVVPNHIQNNASYDKMVQHELIHCRQYHTVDLFIGELVIILQWFNPFAWLLRKAISENLEFLVDEEMITKGANARDYQYSLLSFSMVGQKPAVANYFNTNLLKKRIAMMNTRKYPGKYRLHNFLIPVCLVIALAITASFQKEAVAKESLKEVSKVDRTTQPEGTIKQAKVKVQPLIVGSVIKSATSSPTSGNGEEIFLRHILTNIRYPKEAAHGMISGVIKVMVTFNQGNVAVKKAANISNVGEMKEVVVVGYTPTDAKESSSSAAGSADYLQMEVERVIVTFTDIPKDLLGKTFIVPVKFKLQSNPGKQNDLGDVKPDSNNNYVTVLEKLDKPVPDRQPVYILNNSRIISKAEADAISPTDIKSVEVFKAAKVEHKTLGIINNSVVIITMNK